MKIIYDDINRILNLNVDTTSECVHMHFIHHVLHLCTYLQHILYNRVWTIMCDHINKYVMKMYYEIRFMGLLEGINSII